MPKEQEEDAIFIGALIMLVILLLAVLVWFGVALSVPPNTEVILPAPGHKEVTAVDATAGGKL